MTIDYDRPAAADLEMKVPGGELCLDPHHADGNDLITVAVRNRDQAEAEATI